MSVSSKTILIVEDDDVDYEFLCRLLKDHNLKRAKSLKAAIGILKSLEFDVAFCDLGLPDSDGEEIVEELSKHNMGVVVYSGNSNRDIHERCLEAGAHGAFVKGAASHELLQSVMNNAIEISRINTIIEGELV